MKTPRSRITLALLTGLLSLAAVQALLVAIAGHPAAVHAGAPAPSPAAAGPAANAVVLDVRIAPGSNSPAQGQTVTYTLVVSNTGDTTASGAVLSNTLPAGLDYVTATLQATAGSPAYLTTERTIRWDGDLAANSPVTLTYAAVLTTGDFVYNTAVITHPQAFQAAGATSSPVDEWSEPELVDTAPRFGATLGSWRHLAVDSHDVPHVAYAGNALYYATYTGTRWITETVPVTRSRDTTSLGAAALTLDDQGRALIAFYGEDALWLARQVAAPGSSSTSLQPEGSGQALTWTVEHIADVPNSAADYKLDLKRGSDGRLHLVYNYDRELYYTVHNGTAWLTPTVAITQTACSLSPYSSNYGFSLALDQNDVPYVACVQDNAPPYEVRLYTHSAAAPWTTYEVITSSNRYYAYPSLVYDGATPHLAFFQGNTALYHAQRGSGWQTTWVDSVGSGHLQQNAALEIRGGQVAIAYAWYLYTDPDSTSILRLAARPLTDSTWLTETVESFAAGWNRPRPSLALDGAGRAHLAYYYAPDETLRHAAQTGSFTIHTVEESRPIGKSAVAVGSDARIHLAYLSRGLRYATRGPDTLTWTKQLAVPGVDDAWTTELALALDAANVPHVAYREPGQPLYHATLNNTTWVTRSVDPGANLVSAPSIGAEVTNTAHIAYLAIQGSNRVVRHAAFDGSVWTAETLATAGPDTSDHRQSPRLVAQNNQAYVLYADCTAYQAGGTYPINLVLATLDAGSWNTRTLYNFSGTCNGNLNYRLLGDGAGRLAAVAEVWGGSGQPGWQTSTFWIEGGQVTSQTTSQAGGAVSPTGLAPLGGPTPTGQVGIRGDGLEIVTTRNGQKYVQYVDRQGYRSEGTTVGTTRDSWTDLYGLDRQDSTGVVVEQSGAQNTLDVEQNPPPRKPPREPQANATKTATPEGAPGVYATERITYTITLSWLGEEEALIQVRDHIPQGTSLVPGSLSWGPYIPRCQYDPGFRDVTCTGKFPSTDVELTTFVSFAVTTDCEIGTWSTPGFLNRAVVYIGDYEFFPQTLTGEKMPFQLRPSTSGYKRNLLPRRHNVLLYTVPKGDEPEALLRDCALDFYVVANGDKNQPLKMQNDGQGPDLHAGDLHHSLWFTPTDDIVEMLDLYVVEAGQPFAKAVHADTMMLEPRLPRLVVLIDFRALFNEFHEVSQKYPSGQRDPQIKDQNQNRILDYYDLVERIRQYADAHFGVVVDVRRNAYYDPAVDYYADTATRSLMGQEIDALVSALPRSVKSIAIVGTDAVVPYLRVPVSPGAANETRFPTQEVGNTRNPTLADIADASMSEKGRWMSDAQYGTFDLFRTLPDVLRLDMAVGRVFRDFPLDLIALIDRQEQPLYLHKDFSRAWAMETKNDYVDFEELVEEFVLPALRGHYGPGSTTRLNWRPGRMPGYPGFAYGAYWLSGNRLLRPDDEYWQPEDIKDRVRTDSDLLIFIGHGTEKGVSDGEGESFIGRGDLAAGVVAGPAISHFGLVISSGCHTGLLPAFRSAPTWRNNWLSNAVLDANAALIAATSYDVSVSFLGDQLDVYHDQMRRLILERLFRDRYPTIGDVLVAANRSYRLRRTGGDDNDLRTLYSVHLIGLPTQPVDRGYGNRPGQASATGSPAETPRWDASPQAASAGQATHTITRSVAISHFEVLTDAQGRVGFTLPHNGGLDGESGAPGLPLVQHSYPLPLAATEVTVTLTLTQARDYGAAVEMIPTVLVEKSWGPQTTIVTLTTPYPQAILTSRVYTDADGLRLDVRLTPLQYHPQTRRVTLYDRLDYQVTYSAPATYTVQDITANNGAPANVNQASLPISVTLTAAQPFSGTLDWEILDMAGRMLDGGAEAVTLDAGTSQVGLTGDTLGWKPGLKQVLVSLSTGRSVTETGVLVAGGQALFAVQGNSLAVEAGKPVYGPGDAAATFTATVRDATGAQLSGLAGNFTQQLDDNPLALTWREGGSYTATLDLAGIVTGQHTLTVTLPAGGKAARSFIIDRDPPTSTLWSPTIVSTPTFTVTISGGDDLSGVDVYHVQYRAGESGAWTDWLTRTTGYDYSHTGLNELTLTFGPTSPVPVASGATYSFRVQAVDRAGNEEAEHSQADTATSISAACSTLTTAFVTAEPAGSLDLAAQVSNTAGAQVPAGLPVAFYANSSLIGTATTTQALAAAASEVVTVTWPGETPGDHIITIVPNDDGTGTGPVALCSPPAPVQQLVSILDVPLAESWNLISSYVHPFTPDITVVQRPISGTYAVIQSFDGGALSYYPDLPAEVNTLKEMKAEYGYWIKRVNSEQPALATLRVVGETFAADRPLALAAGWNLVSYLPRQPLPVTTALQSIDGHYSAVLGFAGGALSYYPDLDPSFNTLTAMEPLHGYWLKLNQAGTLHYPVTSHQLSVNSSPSPVISDPSAQTTDHWSPVTDHSPVTPTPTWVNFYGLAHLPDGTPLAIATTVLAVDPDGVTCGATAVTTEGQYGLLACYGDDPDTPEDEGARPGDTIRLVVDGQVLGTGMWTAHGERQWAPLGAVELHRLWLPLLRRGDG